MTQGILRACIASLALVLGTCAVYAQAVLPSDKGAYETAFFEKMCGTACVRTSS